MEIVKGEIAAIDIYDNGDEYGFDINTIMDTDELITALSVLIEQLMLKVPDKPERCLRLVK